MVLIDEMNRWEGGMLWNISREGGWLLMGTNKPHNYPPEHAQTGRKRAVVFQRMGKYGLAIFWASLQSYVTF